MADDFVHRCELFTRIRANAAKFHAVTVAFRRYGQAARDAELSTVRFSEALKAVGRAAAMSEHPTNHRRNP